MKLNRYILIMMLLQISHAHADFAAPTMPSIITTEWQKVEMLGTTKFKRFGIHIYDASLWSIADPVSDDVSEDSKLGRATALCIQYARNISADKLLSSTYKQWLHLGFADQYPLDAWLQTLEKLWPNVKPGDNLIFIASTDGINRFYSRDKYLGSISDTRFSSAFLDIWLSPDAKYQKHRKELLGET